MVGKTGSQKTGRRKKAGQKKPESVLSRRWVLLIGVVAVVARLAHVLALRDSPYFTHPIIDAKTYHDAALAIAAGEGHPDKIFWQPPGYAYFLALLYKIVGPSFVVVKMIQTILGALTAVLTAWIGTSLLRPSVGIGAGLIVALYGTLVYFDGELLTPTLTIVMQLTAVALFLRARQADRNRWWVASGVVGGLASIVTAPSLVIVGVMAWFARRRALPLLMGAVIAITPVTIRNVKGGELVPISHNGGINFYIGNNANYDATVGIRPDREWKKLTSEPTRNGVTGAVASSNYFVARSFDYLKSDPLGFVTLQLRKIYLIASGNEFYRNQAIYPTRLDSPVLAVLLWKVPVLAFPFGLLLPLALVGLYAGGRRVRFLTMVVGLYALAVVAFFVTARYRLPLVPFLAIFAAEGVRWFVKDARGRRRMIAVAVAVAAFGIANIGQGEMRLDMNADAKYSLGVQLAEHGREEEAMSLYNEVLQQKPDYAEAWLNLGVVHAAAGRHADAEGAFVNAFRYDPDDADALVNLANLKVEAGSYAEAERFYKKALEMKPGHVLARENLQVLKQRASPSRSDEPPSDEDLSRWLERYDKNPGDMNTLGNLVAAYELRGELDKAVDLLREATARRPADPTLHFSLGRIQIKMGQTTQGIAALRHALSFGGPVVRGWIENNPDVAPVRGEILGVAEKAREQAP